MREFNSSQLLDQLLAETRHLIEEATMLKREDPAMLLDEPAPGKWSVVQVLEHLNSYGRYYLVNMEKAMQQNAPAVEKFQSGWLGNYFTKMMKPGEDGRVHYKMKTPKDHRPSKHLNTFPVFKEFIEQQHYLLQLLELAKTKDIARIRVPISLSKFIKLKLGDTFRFLIAHEQRHFVQIHRNLAFLKSGSTNKTWPVQEEALKFNV